MMAGAREKAILFVSALIVSAIFSEVILRIFVVQETKRLASYDADIGWRGVPNGEGVYVRLKDSINVPFRYNRLGFRDEEIPPASQRGFQVVMLGDSFVESLEVVYERTFQELVENALQERMDSSSLVNISSQGYSTAQEILAYRKFRGLLDPDLVLLAFYTGNDFDDNLRESFASMNGDGALVFNVSHASEIEQCYLSFKRWLYEHSHLVYFAKNAVENLSGARLAENVKSGKSATAEYSRRMTKILLLEAGELTAAEGIPFGVVVFPSRKEIQSGDVAPTAFVSSVCEEAGIPYVRLDNLLEPSDYFAYDEHLNESGHRIVAAEIIRFIDSFSILPNEAREAL
jgi:hypothetical protein